MNDDQLRETNGTHVLKIKGFSMHSNIDALNTSCGNFMFIKNSKNEIHSAHEGRHNYYNHQMLINVVLGIRKLRCTERTEGSDPPPGITVSGWHDGILEQIKNLVSLSTYDKDLLYLTFRLKHAPSAVAENNLQIYATPLKQKKNASKTLTVMGEIEMIRGKRIGRTMECVSDIVN